MNTHIPTATLCYELSILFTAACSHFRHGSETRARGNSHGIDTTAVVARRADRSLTALDGTDRRHTILQ